MLQWFVIFIKYVPRKKSLGNTALGDINRKYNTGIHSVKTKSVADILNPVYQRVYVCASMAKCGPGNTCCSPIGPII